MRKSTSQKKMEQDFLKIQFMWKCAQKIKQVSVEKTQNTDSKQKRTNNDVL